MPGTFRQHVPRPSEALPGAPPPWRDALGVQKPSVPLGLVRKALAKTGEDRCPRAPTGGRVEAAVLAALYGEQPGDAGEATVLLIRRSAHLERDPGHVAFPGGIVEPGEGPVEAALREAHEEVGLPPCSVEVLGSLPTVERPRAGSTVLPFVGLLPERPVLLASPAEVEAILEVRLSELLVDGVAWEERWPESDGATEGTRRGSRPVCFFASPSALGDDLVWGVTARILWDLLDRVVSASGRR